MPVAFAHGPTMFRSPDGGKKTFLCIHPATYFLLGYLIHFSASGNVWIRAADRSLQEAQFSPLFCSAFSALWVNDTKIGTESGIGMHI